MAKSLCAILVGLALLAGCQQNQVVVEQIPVPNLDGPNVQPPKVHKPFPEPAKGGNAARPKPRPADVPAAWIPSSPVNRWRWIVVHHSATPAGGAASFDRMHRQKGWDELGYHFVIGNGTGSKDGEIEVGSRWPKQKWGAHAKTPNNDYNNFGIGICLVGNFEIDRPTPAQLKSLARLTAHLVQTYRLPVKSVIGHAETHWYDQLGRLQTKPTDCPGRHLQLAEVRRLATQVAQQEGLPLAEPMRTASGELLFEVTQDSHTAGVGTHETR